MDDAKVEEAKKRLREVVPLIRVAMEMAKLQVPGGKVELAIIAKEKSGGGRITACFEGEEFFVDLEAVLGSAA